MMAARLVFSCLGQVVTERVLGTPSSLPATHQCHLSIFTAHTVTHRTCLPVQRLMLMDLSSAMPSWRCFADQCGSVGQQQLQCSV